LTIKTLFQPSESLFDIRGAVGGRVVVASDRCGWSVQGEAFGNSGQLLSFQASIVKQIVMKEIWLSKDAYH